MRTDLNMRKGKMVAQGAHASIMFLAHLIERGVPSNIQYRWLEAGMTKICCRVDSEEQLLDIYTDARQAGLLCNLVMDAGKTEFNGVPTRTCLAIGPDSADKIDQITGHLKLL